MNCYGWKTLNITNILPEDVNKKPDWEQSYSKRGYLIGLNDGH